MKKLVITTVISVLTAVAQAQDAKVYGVLDAGQYYINQKDAANNTGLNSKMSSTSRFGITVTEDIGKGLNTGVKIETDLNLSTGGIGSTTTGTAAGSFNRAANVFLASQDLGTITLGRQPTPIFIAASTGDALGMNSMGFINAIVGSTNNTNPITGEVRAAVNGVTETVPGLYNAGISYKSPNVLGFTASVFTTPNTGTRGSSITDAGQRDMLVSYTRGSLNAVVGQAKTFTTTGNDFATRNLYAANYTIGALKVTGGYQQTRYDTYHDIDVKSVGARYQITVKTAVGASWTTAEDKTVSANKNTTYGVAGFYDFSKRTQVYGLISQTKNEGTASLNPIYAAPSLPATTDGYALGAGIKHSF